MPTPPKSACYAACLTNVHERLAAARAGMAAAQESSNSETKSSAGDKYETGRAMAQQERDRHAAQLHEVQQQLVALQKIDPNLVSKSVRLGALATTSLGLVYISSSLGRLTTNTGQEFMALSPAAPLAGVLHGKQAGETTMLNGKVVRVLTVS